MADNILKDLLKEYELKRLHAEQLADEKKENLINTYPEYDKINSAIIKCGLDISREKLQSNDTNKIESLKAKLESLKNDKHNFLKSINMDESDLLPKYDCPICNDTGYVSSNGNLKSMCSCLKQKLINISYNKSNINKLDDENFKNFAIDELVKMNIITKDDVLDSCIARVKKAYPAYFDTYNEIDKVINYLNGYDNLFCIGRNGQHRYNNMDHSILTGFVAVDKIINNDKDKTSLWNINTEKEYHEAKQ